MKPARPFSSGLGRRARDVTLVVINGVSFGRSLSETEAAFDALSSRKQVFVICAVLAGLLGLALVAASFGVAGLAVYFLAVILIAR